MSDELRYLHVVKNKVATKTRIHLEDAIMDVWQTEKDLKGFIELLVDHPDIRLDEQEVWNYVDSIRKVHDMRMHVLMDTFAQAFHLDGYGTLAEVLACDEKQEDASVKKKGKKK